MTPKTLAIGAELHEYLVAHGMPPDEVQQELISETMALGGVSRMQIAPEQGAFLTLLTRLVNARNAVELGTFTGYSALTIARGLAEGGRLLAWKGARNPDEEAAGRRTADLLGLEQQDVRSVTPYRGSRNRHLHLYQKVRPCPPEFPRRVGVARRKPLGQTG